jgi:ABC-2 type transport system ATP-binding protein
VIQAGIVRDQIEYAAAVLLEAKGLVKRFGKLTAVDGVSLGVAAGSCTGLLGPNGAGKTTTVSMIAGLVAPDAGEVLLSNHAVRGETDAKKRKIGFVPQDLALYEELPAQDNLDLFGALYGLPPAALERAARDALQLVGLTERAADKVKTFSGGMKRRLNLAAALLHDPELLILDEPTVGVDPQSRSAIFDNLEALRKRGKGILYTTHYMEEAERLCDRIVIVDHGKVVADDSLRGLEKLAPPTRRLTVALDDTTGTWLADLRTLVGVETAEIQDQNLSVTLDDLARAPGVLAFLTERQQRFTHFATERVDLEDIFLNLTGRHLRDA